MIMHKTARVRRWSYALGASVAAVAASSASPASAQCNPDPTLQFGTTDCTGTDENGLVISTIYTQVNVATSAIVRAGSGAGAITAAAIGSSMTVNGLVDGLSKAGLAAVAGPSRTVPCDPYAGASIGYCAPGSTMQSYPAAGASVSIGEGGTITGAQALLMTRDLTNTSGAVNVTLINAGTMTGTAGPAVVNAAGTNSTLSINNLATGTIGGISGPVEAITNAGLIDGGSATAITTNSASPRIVNSGRIVSSSGTAISTGGALRLANSGTIVGSVISTAAAGQLSEIDTRQGTIVGDLLLGAGNDTVRALFDTASGRISSITGRVDGGAGSDTIVIAADSDTTIGAIVLPTNFELLGLDISDNAAVTLAPSFTTGSGIALSGVGTVINQADIVTSGPAVTPNYFGTSLTFVNEGNVTATLPGSSQAAVSGIGYVTNGGTISAIGTASSSTGVQAMYSINNTGAISATGTAASITYGTLINSGTILSTGGVGADVTAGTSSTNTGTITGATTGLVLQNASLTNTGTIVGGNTGVALGYGGVLLNAAGGTVTGGVSNSAYNVRVSNAGLIEGSVIFASGLTYDFSDDVFVDAGGVIDGAIVLGGGDDRLVVNIAADPARPLAGAADGVDAGAGYDTLHYIVNADASANLALPTGFEALTYELDNAAALTLNAVDPITSGIGLTGNGTVTLEGAIAVSDHSVIDANVSTSAQIVYGTAGPDQKLTIINNGSLSLTKTEAQTYSLLAAVTASAASFTNNGSINVTSVAGSYYPAYGVYGGSTITNTGMITLTGGGTAIGQALSVVNTGTIVDTDQAGARGVAFVTALDNSGTIRVDGNAVEAGYSSTTIANSGTIESRSATAVGLGGYNSFLVNEATGTIKGQTAVDITSGGLVINRGAIVGDVAGYAYSYGSTTYVADGGTVEGNLIFGAGSDTFVMTGTETGVTGTIDGGSGDNLLGYALIDSASVSLDARAQFVGFGNAMVQVADAKAVATVTAADPFMGTLYVSGTGKVVNTAAITGDVVIQTRYLGGAVPLTNLYSLTSFENQGTISGSVGGAIAEFANSGDIGAGVSLNGETAIFVNNSGTISSRDAYSAALELHLGGYYDGGAASAALVNSGTISAILPGGSPARSTLGVYIDTWYGEASITNTATGTIDAQGESGIGLLAYNADLVLDNAGLIRGGYGAVVAAGDRAVTIRNSGTLDGLVWLDAGADRVENSGMITGAVLLGGGDDAFIQHTGATIGGLVDGGEGDDRFVIDAVGNTTGALDASQITGFEQIAQTGSGTIVWSGMFDASTIALEGGTLKVAAGQTLATAGAITVTGGDSGVRVANGGTITGSVLLGSGNDTYTEGAGSLAAGGIEGGAGIDRYVVALAGDRTGIGARTGFEQLAVEGAGTLALTLDQSFQSVALSGTNLKATLGGFTIGRIDGTATAERISLDGNVDVVALGGGEDSLLLTLAQGATFTGSVDLGDGDDSFVLVPGGTLAGTIAGGAGNDSATLALANAFTLTSGRLTGFEHLQTQGAGALTLANGGFGFDTVVAGSDITVASGASLAAGLLTFGPAARQLTIAGGFDGSVAGGTGVNTIEVSGGDSVAPVAFATISDVEVLRLSAGLATVSDRASLGSVALAGGRLIGLAGSTITAPVITVASGATFGSAGTVNGNVTVAGTLSPGASPGTMTVNGNVALASSSVSVFEITPTVSDKLVINGSLSIAQGATLQIVAAQAVTPGQSLDLITVSGGITGSYTNIVKPASLFGFVVQRDDTISLLGQFLNDPGYTPQVRGAIDYVNGVLVSGAASDALLAAVPDLVTASGASDQAAFARLTPEAYASATQIAVEQGLELANIGRSDAFAARTNGPGAYTFASALGSTRTLESGTQGASKARTNGYGFLGGIGWGGEAWSLGAFVGYLDSRQTLATLGARTELDAVVAGIHGRWSEGGLGIKATVAYHGGNATTHRALPGGSARGDYDLTGWIADISLDYAAPLGPDWTVRPSLGMTAIRVTRDGVAETGGSAYALDVARDRDHALFVDAGMTFQGGMRKEAALRPYLTLGVRYQVEGRTPHALAALDGGGFGLGAAGASRAPVVASATVGSNLAVSSRLTLFGALSGEAGDADNRASGRVGLRFAF